MLPERLAAARQFAGLSARALDRLAGLGEGHVSMIESGRRPRIEAGTAEALARVLGLSLDWLLAGSGKAPRPKAIREAVAAARAARLESTGTDG